MWRKRSPIVACVQILPRNSNNGASETLGTHLLEFQEEHYLLSVCYRSKFPEVTKNEELKRQFGVHGIPVEAVSDNGPPNSEAANFKNLRKSTVSSIRKG